MLSRIYNSCILIISLSRYCTFVFSHFLIFKLLHLSCIFRAITLLFTRSHTYPLALSFLSMLSYSSRFLVFSNIYYCNFVKKFSCFALSVSHFCNLASAFSAWSYSYILTLSLASSHVHSCSSSFFFYNNPFLLFFLLILGNRVSAERRDNWLHNWKHSIRDAAESSSDAMFLIGAEVTKRI